MQAASIASRPYTILQRDKQGIRFQVENYQLKVLLTGLNSQIIILASSGIE